MKDLLLRIFCNASVLILLFPRNSHRIKTQKSYSFIDLIPFFNLKLNLKREKEIEVQFPFSRIVEKQDKVSILFLLGLPVVGRV